IAFTVTPAPLDISRTEIWVADTLKPDSWRASPLDGRGYCAPIWIDSHHLGALTPNDGRFDVVAIDAVRGSARRIGTIDTADCDWSPDRSRIVYAMAPADRANSPDDPT